MPIRGIALETSGREGSVAAMLDGGLVCTERFEHGLKHAAGLVPMLARVIAQAGWTEPEVEEVYLSLGPGSFTGLRIGVTLAKSWWLARDLGGPGLAGALRLIPVASARVIVENLPDTVSHAAVVLDAKRGQVFTASYERSKVREWTEHKPPRLSTMSELLRESPRPLMLTGEGLKFHDPGDLAGVERAQPEFWQARAECLGNVGYRLAREGIQANPLTVVPTYIRLPEAEEKWREAHAASAGRES